VTILWFELLQPKRCEKFKNIAPTKTYKNGILIEQVLFQKSQKCTHLKIEKINKCHRLHMFLTCISDKENCKRLFMSVLANASFEP